MCKRLIPLLLVTVLLSLLIVPVPAVAQVRNAESVIRSIVDAINTSDVDAALALVAEDAVITLLPPPPGTKGVFTGKDEIRGWWQEYVTSHGHAEFTSFQVFGNTAVWTANIKDDLVTSLGVGALTFEGVGVVQDGLLKTYAWSMNKESQIRFDAALAVESKKEIVRRFYEEIWTEGKMETIDEIIHPDFIDRLSGQNGIDAFRATVTLFRTAFPDHKMEYTDLVIDGDIVVVNATSSGTYQGSLKDIFGIPDSAIGKKAVWYGTHYARIVDGKYVEGWGTGDLLSMFQQLDMKLVPITE